MTIARLMIDIEFLTANPLAKSSFFFFFAVYGQQDTEQMLLLLTALSDTDVPSGSLVLVTPCQKKGFLSPQMTLLSKNKKQRAGKKKNVWSGGTGRIHIKHVMMTFQIFRE